MLIGSGRRVASNPVTYSTTVQQQLPPGSLPGKNRFTGYAAYSSLSSLPVEGASGQYAWLQPRTGGAMGSRSNGSDGVGDLTASGAMGVNGVADINDAIAAISAVLQLVTSGEATIAGSGTVSSANVQAALAAVASITADSSISAVIDALGFALSTVTGVGSVSPTLTARGALLADIQPFTELSPQSLANAVWTAPTAEYPDAGTMGKAVSDAGSAGNPWASPVTGNTSAGSFGALVNDMSIEQLTMSSDIASLEALITALQAKVDELHAIEGLNALEPMTVTPTSRTAGDITLTITGDGVTSNTVTRT